MCANQYELMKTSLMSCVQSQMANLKDVDAKELGEAIDMLKDLEEAMYYCTITEAMQKKEEEPEIREREYHYFTQPRYEERDMDREWGRMYYGGRSNNSTSSSGNGSSGGRSGGRYYTEPDSMIYDPKEGRSHQTRKTYMESKEMHKDKASQLKELEKYMQELTQDMVEMIEGATPEEKQLLQQKLTLLASKVK